jgi:hypothetical protein
MEVPQIVLRELHRKDYESEHFIKYRINLNNHKHSLQKRKYYFEIITMSLLQPIIPRATMTTLQPALGTPDISVNIPFFCIAYSYTLKMEEARSSETPTRRTKLHGVTSQNTVIFTQGTPYKLSVLMQDEIHRGQKMRTKQNSV